VQAPTRWRWLLESLFSQLWFRASLFSLLGVVAALAALLLEPFIPHDWPPVAGADAVDRILGILGSSMLTVTVFSLTTMVSAYNSAASNVTPRTSQLLQEDTTSQNALSTFLGAFLFSLVGIIALSTGLYGPSGRLVLFSATVLVVLVIVVTLLRWISHLSTLGQVSDSIARVERAVTRALDERVENPFLGGIAPQPMPASATPVHGEAIGYLVHVDMAALQKAAGTVGTVQVAVLPGGFVDGSQPLAWLAADDEETRDAVRRAFTVSNERNYAQDPRFGLIVLSEIASRSLSPAINDSGTAIAVLGLAVRVLARWRSAGSGQSHREIAYPRVQVPGLSTDDLFDDLFGPIARDGAGIVEVGMRLQKALGTLARGGDESICQAARYHSARALALAEGALVLESDRQRLRELASSLERLPST
jgi:uncharacterized membrane protein